MHCLVFDTLETSNKRLGSITCANVALTGVKLILLQPNGSLGAGSTTGKKASVVKPLGSTGSVSTEQSRLQKE